jgi:ABC-type transporter Mla MlaB component
MPVSVPIKLPVRWDLLLRPDGTARIAFTGELDAESTPEAWRNLEKELAGKRISALEIDVQQLICDSAGLALLYYFSIGGMTPGASVSLNGLSAELQHLLHSFSKQDFQTWRNTSRLLHHSSTMWAPLPGCGFAICDNKLNLSEKSRWN